MFVGQFIVMKLRNHFYYIYSKNRLYLKVKHQLSKHKEDISDKRIVMLELKKNVVVYAGREDVR